MSKLIKAAHLPIVEIKKLFPHVEEKAGGKEENSLFCPFSIEDSICERLPSSPIVDEEQDSSEQDSSDVEIQEEPTSPTPSPTPQELADEILKDAREEAHRIRQEAEKFLESARRKAEEIESQAYNSGFEQGKKDGEELGKRQFEAMCNRLKSLIESLNVQGQELFSKYEAQMVRLCMKIAQKVVEVELEIHPEVILEVIRRASQEIQEATEIKVFLHPKDLEIVKDSVVNDIDLSGGHKMEFLPNESIGRGGCIIETEFGLVDATLEARWKAIEEALEKALSKEVE